MREFLFILFLLFLFSCGNIDDPQSTEPLPAEPTSNSIIIDTVNSSFPVQIGNNTGNVDIVGIRKYKNQELINSEFTITLVDHPKCSIMRAVNKAIIIDSNEYVHLIDSAHNDYLDSAVLKEVEFLFVRANTLYFKALLENLNEEKEIQGRFNLFYQTKKKGRVYGWITDEVK